MEERELFLLRGGEGRIKEVVRWSGPSRERSHIPPWEKENHRLKSTFGRGYADMLVFPGGLKKVFPGGFKKNMVVGSP